MSESDIKENFSVPEKIKKKDEKLIFLPFDESIVLPSESVILVARRDIYKLKINY